MKTLRNNILLASVLFISVLHLPASGQPGIISTLVGGGTADNVPATSAALWGPISFFVTPDGTIYFSDHNNSRVRKVDLAGTITTIAGTGARSYSGDGGLATDAELFLPIGLHVLADGTVYIADYYNHRVRKIDPAGIITTIAGNGTGGFSGDGGLATSAKVGAPVDVILDGAGNLYISSLNHVIRKVDAAGIITTIAGTGVSGYNGDGILATTAQLSSPHGLAFDSAGNLHVSETGNKRVRKIDATTQLISTVAGNGNITYSGDGGPATSADISHTPDLCFDAADNFYIPSGHRVRRIDAVSGVITAIAGAGIVEGQTAGDGGPAIDASLRGPAGIFCANDGDIYIADYSNNRVRKIDFTTQFITTVAGGGAGDGGPVSEANVNIPYALGVDGADNIYIADHLYQRIRKVDAAGTITRVAGTGYYGFSGDGGPAIDAEIAGPLGVHVTPAGIIYIADTYNHRIRKVDASGTITTIAGSGPTGLWYATGGFAGDGGPATSALLKIPYGVYADAVGNVYFTDAYNHRIRKIDPAGIITTIAGTGVQGYSGDGGPATSAELKYPWGIHVTATGEIYFADGNHVVRKIDGAGTITTVAGDGTPGYSGDGGPATSAQLHTLNGIHLDHVGNLYIAEAGNNRIRMVDAATQIITTVAGNGWVSYSGDGVAATSTTLYNPSDAVTDSDGDLYIADRTNHRVRKVVAVGPPVPGVDVSIPDVLTPYATTVQVPVEVAETSGQGIVAAEVFVAYDGDLITAFSAELTGTLAEVGWSIQTNIVEGQSTNIDTIKIAMATDDDDLVGAGTLVNLSFQVPDIRVPGSTALTLSHVLFNDGTPLNTTTDGSLTIIGATAIVTSLPATIIPRETITITVLDADLDTDGNPGNDQVSVTVENTSTNDIVNLILDEDGATAGTFSGTVDTEFGTAAIVDALIQAQAGQVIIATYSDALDATGNGPINRTATTNVLGGADGNVAITLVSQPGDPLYLQVIDGDLNTSVSSAQTASVTVVNSRTLESFTVVLTEVDIDDDVFFGLLPTTSGASTSTDMNTAEDDLITASYDDVVTLVGDQQDRTDSNDVIYPWGDADDNDVLQAFDAAKILVHVLNGSLIDELAANVDDETVTSGINPFDASLVLQKRVGLIATFPVQDPTAENHPQGDPASPKLLPEQRSLSLVAGEGYLSVVAGERQNIVAGDLVIEGVKGRVEMGAELGEFLLASRPTDAGLRVVFAGAVGVSGPGELLRVYGVGPWDAASVRAAFNNGAVTGTAAWSGAVRPGAYALYPNMPNPFNPETAIRFELPQDALVELIVYDVLGRQVKVLVAGHLPAGEHRAVWDGRDASDRPVANGIYVYRLQAGGGRGSQRDAVRFSQVRRMLLLK